MTEPTEVCLTVDTEFSIGGAFTDPIRHCPIGEDRVYCPVDGRDHGLGFILRTLETYDQQATFFVETANTAYFGDHPMGRVVETILKADQDIQLHLHPCWEVFEDDGWPDRVRGGAPDDQCANLGVDHLSALIEKGIDAFRRWGTEKPIALRTGNLSAGQNVYRAMRRAGLELGSNIAAGYAPPADESLMLMGGLSRIEDVVEAPVLSYAQLRFGRWSKKRMLAITASSWSETRALLTAARQAKLSPVVILTHPFEFIKSPGTSGDLPNLVNQRRLEKLCAFVASNRDDFVMTTFGGEGRAWIRRDMEPAPLLRAPLDAVLGRMITNAINDRVSFL